MSSPNVVNLAYGAQFNYGPDYIIPKPFDPRMLIYVPLAVAEAAMRSGVARLKLDLAEYKRRLEETVGALANL